MKRLALILSLLGCSMCLSAQEDRDYDGTWNRPTISHSSFKYQYVFFGKSDPRDRKPRLDKTSFPPIPGLKYRSCYAICPVDTCYGSWAVMAIRCLENPALLKWASSRAAGMAEWCKSGMYEQAPPKYIVGNSPADICNKYISRIKEEFCRQECHKDSDMPNEQFGFLLTDCWATEKFCTFYEATWYDMLSCGDTTRESYYSVDILTGKVATLSDIIPETKWPALAKTMLRFLRSGNGELWHHPEFEWVPEDSLGLLKEMDGCALIREGLVIYYYPYHIGAGADGEYKAIIPYKILNTL